MAIKKSRPSSLPLSARQWFSHATLALLMAVGLMLLVMSKTNNPGVIRLRTAITDAVTPVLSVAAAPMDAIYHAGTWVADMSRLRAENVALKNQNIELLQWQSAAKQLANENKSLQGLLRVVPSYKNSYITARVVADMGGPYVHSALLGAGGDSGIKKDQAVISDSGLLGRIIDVGANSSRVLLLGDINSRVPVMAERTHEKSILIGNNSDWPTLSYLAADSKIEAGDRIVTSGDGGVFPKDIPVGVVTSVDKGIVKVQPFVDPPSAEYVSVIDFSL